MITVFDFSYTLADNLRVHFHNWVQNKTAFSVESSLKYFKLSLEKRSEYIWPKPAYVSVIYLCSTLHSSDALPMIVENTQGKSSHSVTSRRAEELLWAGPVPLVLVGWKQRLSIDFLLGHWLSSAPSEAETPSTDESMAVKVKSLSQWVGHDGTKSAYNWSCNFLFSWHFPFCMFPLCVQFLTLHAFFFFFVIYFPSVERIKRQPDSHTAVCVRPKYSRDTPADKSHCSCLC